MYDEDGGYSGDAECNPDEEARSVTALIELPRWDDGSADDAGVVHSGYPRALPKPSQSDPAWGVADTTITNGVIQHPGGLPFPAHSVVVDNWSNAWLRVSDRWYIAPGERGRIICLSSAIRVPECRLQAPPGFTQPSVIVGTSFVQWMERQLPPVAGQIIGGSANLASGQVSVGTSATLIVTGDGGTVSTAVTNNSGASVFLGGPGVTTTTGWELITGGTAVFRGGPAVYGVAAAAKTVSWAQSA